jgi:hypothetical protein
MPWLAAGWVWKELALDGRWWLDINNAGDFEFNIAPDNRLSHTPIGTVISNNS